MYIYKYIYLLNIFDFFPRFPKLKYQPCWNKQRLDCQVKEECEKIGQVGINFWENHRDTLLI